MKIIALQTIKSYNGRRALENHRKKKFWNMETCEGKPKLSWGSEQMKMDRKTYKNISHCHLFYIRLL